MEEITQQSNATYEDNVAETILLSQRLPVGSYWKDDEYVYKINQIVLGNYIASAGCTKITLKPGPDALYDYKILNSDIFVHGLDKLTPASEGDYCAAEDRILFMFEYKNFEMFQKQCLFTPPTDIPFEDFATVHDEIIELDGFSYFFYRPGTPGNSSMFRLIRINMDTYDGAETMHDEWHFFMDKKHILACGPNNKRQNNFGQTADQFKLYPFTEYQFNQLVEFIENNPNQPENEIH